jgi:hypothetical protein
MTESKDRPQFSDRGTAEAEARKRRQAEALRANLARRKEQSRARADEPATMPATVPGSTGETGGDGTD